MVSRSRQTSRSARSKPTDTVATYLGERVRDRVVVRRSPRRTSTVSAFREHGAIVVAIPAAMSARDERRWVSDMVDKLTRKERSAAPTNEALLRRAEALAAQYLPEGPRPTSVRWVTNQQSRWGSCTPARGTIRLSHRLQPLPDFVIDYVLLHELAHLHHSDHGPAFWALLDAYPMGERARGYLDGYAKAQALART